MPEANCVAIFCDDIREEMSGQHSLIGIYGDNLAVPSFPGAIGKIGIYVRLNLSLDFEPTEFRTFLNSPTGERFHLSTIPQTMVQDTIRKATEEGNFVAGFYSHTIAAPLPVGSAGRFVVELEWDGGARSVGGLNLSLGHPVLDPPPTPR